jgi:hypothetical protein
LSFDADLSAEKDGQKPREEESAKPEHKVLLGSEVFVAIVIPNR